MGIRRHLLVLVVLLIPAAARADKHHAELFLGPSVAHGSALWGFHASGAWLPGNAKSQDPKTLSVVGDFSAHWGQHEGTDQTRLTFLAGVRHTFAQPKGAGSPHRNYLPFVQALVGGVRTSSSVEKGTKFAAEVGNGLDCFPWGEKFGIRIQGDFIVRFSGGLDTRPRLSAGVVYRYGEKSTGASAGRQ